MRRLLIVMPLLLTCGLLWAQSPVDSTQKLIETPIFVIPAGPVAGSFTSAASTHRGRHHRRLGAGSGRRLGSDRRRAGPAHGHAPRVDSRLRRASLPYGKSRKTQGRRAAMRRHDHQSGKRCKRNAVKGFELLLAASALTAKP